MIAAPRRDSGGRSVSAFILIQKFGLSLAVFPPCWQGDGWEFCQARLAAEPPSCHTKKKVSPVKGWPSLCKGWLLNQKNGIRRQGFSRWAQNPTPRKTRQHAGGEHAVGGIFGNCYRSHFGIVINSASRQVGDLSRVAMSIIDISVVPIDRPETPCFGLPSKLRQ